MNAIPAQEIKRRGISVVDELLAQGPVQVIKNNRPRYVVMTTADYERLTAGRSVWDWLDLPSRATRDKAAIDADLQVEREAWDGSA